MPGLPGGEFLKQRLCDRYFRTREVSQRVCHPDSLAVQAGTVAVASMHPSRRLLIPLSERRPADYISSRGERLELFIFGRFHARPGDEGAVEDALRTVVGPSREEAGCLSIQAFRSDRDPRLFYIHSRWVDEAAFDHHASLPHTVRFIERVQALIDHPLDVTRARLVG